MTANHPKTIAELYQLARNGDKKAETELLQELLVRFRYLSKRRLGVEYDEDIAQEACLVVIEKYQNLEPSIHFEPWAYQILRNKIGNHLQAKKRSIDRFATNQIDPSEHTSKSNIDPLMRKQLLDCFKSLFKTNPKYARVLCLSYLGFSPKEICQRLQISRNNMYVILSRSRRILTECLDLENHDQ